MFCFSYESFRSFNYDIGLILLEKSASDLFDREVAWPACLPEANLNLTGEMGFLTGWGDTQPYKPDGGKQRCQPANICGNSRIFLNFFEIIRIDLN